MDSNLKIFGQAEPGTISQMETCLRTGGALGVLCADNHKGYAQPIGGVVAYKDKISVSGVGFDIGCGNLAIKTDAKSFDVITKIEMIMNDVVKKISFGMGRVNAEKVDHALFHLTTWQEEPFKSFKASAHAQLGTVGGGNHYVDLFIDEEDFVWVGVHFGSRGLGHKTATWFLKQGGGKDGMDVEPCVLDVSSDLGSRYVEGMRLAGAYAHAGREWVAHKIAKDVLGASVLDEVHNHHNFAWHEFHGFEGYWVVRKGATPAFPGQRGFVGGSMGDDALIIEGLESQASKEALYSTIHGAGRIMSRTEAKGKSKKVDGKWVRGQGRIRHDDMIAWVKEKGVCLRGGDLDEAPQAYKRLSEVVKAHEGTIKVLHTLKPIGVAMAGKEINDPYKD